MVLRTNSSRIKKKTHFQTFDQGPVSHYSMCSYSVCYTTFRSITDTITTHTIMKNESLIPDNKKPNKHFEMVKSSDGDRVLETYTFKDLRCFFYFFCLMRTQKKKKK